MSEQIHHKTCLVTGATGAIGGATVYALASAGATTVMLARDEGRAEEAAEVIRRDTGNPRVEVLVADLAEPDSIAEAADGIRERHDRLDALLNVAAVYRSRREVTSGGLERMFATNHLGPFLLTHLLLELLRSSPLARIVNVTAPSSSRLDFDDLQGEAGFSALGAFGASKLCNLAFTYELARRLEGTTVSANAFHPGLVKSAIMGEAPAPIRFVFQLVASPPGRAAEALTRLAIAPEFEGANGKFFKHTHEIRSSSYSHDREVQQRLWEASERLVGIERGAYHEKGMSHG